MTEVGVRLKEAKPPMFQCHFNASTCSIKKVLIGVGIFIALFLILSVFETCSETFEVAKTHLGHRFFHKVKF